MPTALGEACSTPYGNFKWKELSLREPVLTIMVTEVWPSWFPQPLMPSWGPTLLSSVLHRGEAKALKPCAILLKDIQPGSGGAESATSHRTGDLRVMVTVLSTWLVNMTGSGTTQEMSLWAQL